MVAVDRQDTVPDGGAADGRRQDRLEVGVKEAVRTKMKRKREEMEK